ncbi:hypothetical protein JFV30_14110 [Pseudomonas sp. TH32]|uniref:DUF6338 family protein n=1 Tax=Pseudomonas sp. TH32 TaxID=2796397 RepID=UPI00191328BE|nr:DUF6338 family protein [Pseudomonas sp. TH32]MBK5437912.1 hypothetical protein [Pseudomonas sp. TH32]
MGEIAGTLMPILQALLPGFLATVVFYWLADAKKPGQFEQVIQALICTGLIKLLVDGVELLAVWLGQWFVLGSWSENTATGWSLGLAVFTGLLLAYCSNHDHLYSIARRFGLTSRASSGEWRYAFRRFRDRGIVLHFVDGRRLLGYPLAWPGDPATGHFLIEHPHWIVDETMTPCTGLTYFMVANSDIYWVEFLERQGS